MIQYTQTPDYYRDCLMHYDFNDPDFLEHHGVKGQRWGFRKQRVLKGRANRSAKTGTVMNTTSGTAKTQRKMSKKGKAKLAARRLLYLGALGAGGGLAGGLAGGKKGALAGAGTAIGVTGAIIGADSIAKKRKLKKKQQKG